MGKRRSPEVLELQADDASNVYRDAPIGLCYLDLELRYVQINEWLAAVNGLTISEHLGRTIGEVLPDVARGVEKQLRRVIASGEAIEGGTVQAETPAHPGVVRTFEHNFYPVRSPDGTVVGVSCTVQDVAERESVKEAFRWYRSMATASRDLMVFVDPTYRYRAVNQAYCDEQRRTPEEILGHTVADVFGKETFEGTLKPHLDRCLKGEHVSFDFWWTSPSRGRRHVEARYDPFFEADGSVSGVAVNVRDTTDRKEIEEQHERSLAALEAANKELELFSASLAHDLRNPLLIVTNFSAHLEEELGDSLDEQLKDDLQRIRGAGRQMMHILEDLRDLADVSRGELTREEVDLSSLAREIVDDLSALAPDREVTLEAEPGITAVGDKTLLRILLSNLLQNAWKYTRPSDDARIELGVEEHESDGPIYYVRDNGIGFEPASREIIFRAFERLHTQGEFPGSGLGLATVERIVRRHGGRVWAEGAPGKGAIFRFTLTPPATDRRGDGRRRDDV
jgi:PAS domain S-box-containing protein